MPFTTHGHKVPGLEEEGKFEGEKARCGGPGLCVKCSSEAGQILRAAIRTHGEETDLFLSPNEMRARPAPLKEPDVSTER